VPFLVLHLHAPSSEEGQRRDPRVQGDLREEQGIRQEIRIFAQVRFPHWPPQLVKVCVLSLARITECSLFKGDGSS
ncbi:hypothetical protein PENTCL1PPCAC_26500, partial [Pristionchus entomophagus]